MNNSFPEIVLFETTEQCNYNCNYCSNNWKRKDTHSHEQNAQNLESIIDEILELGVKKVAITGGEPFTNKTLLFETIKLLSKHNIEISINTNGSLITKNDIDLLGKYNCKLLISIPSINPYKYSKITGSDKLEHVLDILSKIIEKGLDLSCNIVLTKETIEDVSETIQYLYSEIGVDNIFLSPFIPYASERTQDDNNLMLSTFNIESIIDLIKHFDSNKKPNIGSLSCIPHCTSTDITSIFSNFSCGAGKKSVTIEINGNLRACGHMSIVDANILKETRETILSSLSKWQSNNLLPEVCKSCDLLQKCGGGCRANALHTYGSITAVDPLAIPSNVQKITKHNDSDVGSYCHAYSPGFCCDGFFSLTPDNIAIITSIVGSLIGVAATTIKGLSLWVEERKSRKIKIKHGETEIEIHGAMDETQIEKALSYFKNVKTEITEDNVKIEIIK